MSKLRKIAFICVSIFKTLYVNFKVFPFNEALKFRVFCSWDITCKGLKKGSIQVDKNVGLFGVKFGNGGSDGVPKQKSMIIVSDNGLIHFKGKANLGAGIIIRIDGGRIEVGNNFRTNKNAFLACNTEMIIGNDVLLGWNVNIRDSDGHYVYSNAVRSEKERPITIGNHVWICSYADVLKGSVIGDDCVVAYRGCVTGGAYTNNTLIGGVPGKAIKSNITWEE